MDRAFDNFLNDLRQRITLYDVISQKTKLTKKGNQLWGCCPFHNEKTPSFAVSEDKGFYHCFGCGAHGDIIKFTMEVYNMPFMEAVEKLASSVGMTIPKTQNRNPKEILKKNQSKDIVKTAKDFFIKKLADNFEAIAYLKENRRLTDETITQFEIGYAPDTSELYDMLKGLGYSDQDLCDAGLYKKSDYGDGRLYSYFRNRIIFPINNRKGETIAFSGRIIGAGDPKYLNSPESDIFEKRFTLFGFDKALQPSRDSKQLIVVEGNIDVVALHQAGFKNSVAPLGTALTEYQVSFMWQVADSPLICFDGDAAGLKAAIRAAHRILPYLKTNKSLEFCILPDGLDPDNILSQEHGEETFRNILKSTTSLIDILWKEATYGQTFKTPEQKAGLERKLFDLIEEIQDENVKKYYTQTIKNYLWEFFKYKAEFKKRVFKDKSFELANENIRTLLAYMSLFPDIRNKYLDYVGKILLTSEVDSTLRQIYNSLENDEELSAFHKNKLKTPMEILLNKKSPDYVVMEEFVKLLNYNSLDFLVTELREVEEQLKTNPTPETFKRFTSLKEEIDKIKSQF